MCLSFVSIRFSHIALCWCRVKHLTASNDSCYSPCRCLPRPIRGVVCPLPTDSESVFGRVRDTKTSKNANAPQSVIMPDLTSVLHHYTHTLRMLLYCFAPAARLQRLPPERNTTKLQQHASRARTPIIESRKKLAKFAASRWKSVSYARCSRWNAAAEKKGGGGERKKCDTLGRRYIYMCNFLKICQKR